MIGGGGNDTFKYVVGDGLDVINGGAGSDTLDYSGTASAVTVDLGAQTATGIGIMASVENVIGGSAADTLTGGTGDKFTGGGNVRSPAAAATPPPTAPLISRTSFRIRRHLTVSGDTLKGIEFVEHSGGRPCSSTPTTLDGGSRACRRRSRPARGRSQGTRSCSPRRRPD